MSLIENIAKDNPDLSIKLSANQGDSLPAHRLLLKAHSSCVRDLPAGNEWDISMLLVEGKPVHRAVVIAWLEVVYMAQDEEKQQEPVPLADLLGFADAAGCSERFISACYKSCTGYLFKLSVAQGQPQQGQQQQQQDGDEQQQQQQQGDEQQQQQEEQDPAAAAAAHFISFGFDGGRMHFYKNSNSSLAWSSLDDQGVVAALSEQQFSSVAQQLAQQLELLLFQAYKLQLKELQKRLHKLIFTNSIHQKSILTRQLLEDVVFSARVMQAVQAAPMQQQVKAAWIDSLLLQPFSLVGENKLFDAHNVSSFDCNLAQLEGELQQSFLGAAAGTRLSFAFDLRNQPTAHWESEDHYGWYSNSWTIPLRLFIVGDAHSQTKGTYPSIHGDASSTLER